MVSKQDLAPCSEHLRCHGALAVHAHQPGRLAGDALEHVLRSTHRQGAASRPACLADKLSGVGTCMKDSMMVIALELTPSSCTQQSGVPQPSAVQSPVAWSDLHTAKQPSWVPRKWCLTVSNRHPALCCMQVVLLPDLTGWTCFRTL